MNIVVVSSTVLLIATATFSVDLTQYFDNDAAEQRDRAALLAQVHAFEKRGAADVTTPSDLASWLETFQSLGKRLQRHDLYVYLGAEKDSNDRDSAAADRMLTEAMTELDGRVQEQLADLGTAKLHQLIGRDPQLTRYSHFIDDDLARAAHERRSHEAIALLAQPAQGSLSDSYKTLRQHALASVSTHDPASQRESFESKWEPYRQHEDAFAAILLPFVTIQNGKAALEGFVDAPEAAYFREGLTSAEVNAVLKALQVSSARTRYQEVVATAAAARLKVQPSDLHTWDLDSADGYAPPTVPFDDAVPIIMAAEQPMGQQYAEQFSRLFDPTAHRVEWCHTSSCDDTGFSLGYAGLTSVLFYGNYQGSTDSMRAVAHEAAHAVHRQFMNESQPLAVYNSGPEFMFESFALFNEFIFLDHLYRTGSSRAMKAYFLRKFLDDATFQIYGSAQEADLEAAIYAGTKAGTIRSATDLDALTLQVFARYSTPRALDPAMKVYWARNRLYFTDPLYDVNYLFAGLLALQYFRQYELNPHEFARRYVALLRNGFTDTPQVLERKFLDIDLDDAPTLVRDAATLIETRAAQLAHLYEHP